MEDMPNWSMLYRAHLKACGSGNSSKNIFFFHIIVSAKSHLAQLHKNSKTRQTWKLATLLFNFC